MKTIGKKNMSLILPHNSLHRCLFSDISDLLHTNNVQRLLQRAENDS